MVIAIDRYDISDNVIDRGYRQKCIIRRYDRLDRQIDMIDSNERQIDMIDGSDRKI